jgi:hypothetical protein
MDSRCREKIAYSPEFSVSDPYDTEICNNHLISYPSLEWIYICFSSHPIVSREQINRFLDKEEAVKIAVVCSERRSKRSRGR